jgi:DNA-binding protein YbaB
MTAYDRIVETAADETGTAIKVVERVFNLMNKLEENEASLKVVGGKVTVVEAGDDNDNDVLLPPSLWDKIDELDFDIVELLDPILRAWQESYGNPNPTLMRFTHHPDDPVGTLRQV